ncbi:uncharacterized protein LY89DRAFT_684967 [Mollisia scopiformis]|uniref:Uncharacterized protein n=1 Tax=Mollisia scopiformis TaxID=149040 RepID=A0A194X9Y2_MOLSC|nr:uncharacterized protein LY89DRAFT_684967 [Mollisia scopiformis]KUJ16980.1 hypothetical protein LY89DRAFT_684967 [Mollisia scopiformis]
MFFNVSPHPRNRFPNSKLVFTTPLKFKPNSPRLSLLPSSSSSPSSPPVSPSPPLVTKPPPIFSSSVMSPWSALPEPLTTAHRSAVIAIPMAISTLLVLRMEDSARVRNASVLKARGLVGSLLWVWAGTYVALLDTLGLG